MGICEALLQSAPFGVSIALTGARVVLGLAAQAGRFFDTVVDGVREIGLSLKCYENLPMPFKLR